jgi:penicillin-binding protein 1A
VWIEFMQQALKDIPTASLMAPEGVTNVGGEWFYDEFGPTSGVTALGMEDKAPVQSTDEEKKSILDLFKSTPAASAAAH